MLSSTSLKLKTSYVKAVKDIIQRMKHLATDLEKILATNI